jgi:hypothetical protein
MVTDRPKENNRDNAVWKVTRSGVLAKFSVRNGIRLRESEIVIVFFGILLAESGKMVDLINFES